MRLMIIESPYAGDLIRNIAYARAAVHDCLERAESPIASHLLFTQEGVLDDTKQAERALGIAAGLAWYSAAEAAVFYCDHGLSGGMAGALHYIGRHRPDLAIEFRFLISSDRYTPYNGGRMRFHWEPAFCSSLGAHAVTETAHGRLEVARDGRAATRAASHKVMMAGRSVASYASMLEGQVGAERFYQFMTMAGPAFTFP